MKRLIVNNYLRYVFSPLGKGILVVAGILLVNACMDIKSYPEEPIIKYKEFRYDDTTLVFTFTDGDGNFGIPSWDSFYPFNEGGPYYHNLIVSFEEKADTGFRPVNLPYPGLSNMRIMDVPQPTGQNKTQRGTIEYNFGRVMVFEFSFPDTFRFTFFIYDYTKNKSNIVSTPPLSYIGWDSASIK
ncbi:MAG: hypothetical protein U0T82_09380 [Bacteroidales bacterium]